MPKVLQETFQDRSSDSIVVTPSSHWRNSETNDENDIKKPPNINLLPLPPPTNNLNFPTLPKLKVGIDGSAKVLVSIVILFLIAHVFRLTLKIYELSSPNYTTIENFQICFALKR